MNGDDDPSCMIYRSLAVVLDDKQDWIISGIVGWVMFSVACGIIAFLLLRGSKYQEVPEEVPESDADLSKEIMGKKNEEESSIGNRSLLSGNMDIVQDYN